MQPTRNVEPSQHEPATGEVLAGRWRVTACLHTGRLWLAADTRMHDRNVILVRSNAALSPEHCEAIEAGSGAVAIDQFDAGQLKLVVLTTAGIIAAAPPAAGFSREARAAAIVRAAGDLSWLFNAITPIAPVRTTQLVVASASPDAAPRILMLPELCESTSDRDEAIRATRVWLTEAAAQWLWGSSDPALHPPRWAESWDAWEQGVRVRAAEPAAQLGALLAVGTGRRVPVATAPNPDSPTTLAPSYAHAVVATRRVALREQAVLATALTMLAVIILLVWRGAQ